MRDDDEESILLEAPGQQTRSLTFDITGWRGLIAPVRVDGWVRRVMTDGGHTQHFIQLIDNQPICRSSTGCLG